MPPKIQDQRVKTAPKPDVRTEGPRPTVSPKNIKQTKRGSTPY